MAKRDDYEKRRLRQEKLARRRSDKAARRADARDRAREARSIRSDPRNVLPQLEPIEGTIRAPKLNENDLQKILDIENEATERIRQHMQSRGLSYTPDPNMLELDLLPAAEAQSFRNRLDELRGVQDLLEQHGAPHMLKPLKAQPDGSILRKDQPFGRFPIELEDTTNVSANEVFYSQLNVQYKARPLEKFEDVTSLYSTPIRRMRQSALERTARQYSHYASTGELPYSGNYTVLDFETTGFDPRNQHVIQMGLRTFTPEGEEIKDKAKLLHIKSTKARVGTVGATSTVEDFMLNQAGVDGTTWEHAMMALLESTEENDYRLAAYNAPFDISFAVDKMKRLRAKHASDRRLVARIDKFLEAMSSRENTVDLLSLARLHHVGITVNPQLVANGYFSPHSVQNILLQTDILERIAANEGEDAVAQGLSRLHEAGFDTWVEQRMARYGFGDATKPLARTDWIDAILNTHVMTTRTPLSIAQVDPSLHGILNQFDLIDRTTGMAKINPFEHMLLQTRQVLGSGVSDGIVGDAAVESARIWASFRNDIFNSSGLLRENGPGVPANISREVGDLQELLAQRGAAYAGLSPFERHLSTTFSREAGDWGEDISSVAGQHFGITRFMETENKVFGATPKVGMQISTLEAILGKDHPGLQSFMMSPFKTKNGDVKEVALQFRFSEGEAGQVEIGKIISALSDPNFLREHNIKVNTALSMIDSLKSRGVLGGVQVGTLSGVQGSGASTIGHDVLAEFQGGTADLSGGRTMVRAYRVADDSEKGVIKIGAMMADIGITPEMHAYAYEQTQAANAAAKDFSASVLRSESTARSMAKAAEDVFSGSTGTIGEKASAAARNKSYYTKTNEFFDKYMRYTTKEGKTWHYGVAGVTALAVGAVIGNMAHKRHKEWLKASEPFLQQPYENDNDKTYTPNLYSLSPARSKRNYLVTADVTNRLDQNKIGHTNMSSRKHSHLFGG